VHYNALFGDGKKGRKKLSTQRRRGAERGFEEDRRRETPAKKVRTLQNLEPRLLPSRVALQVQKTFKGSS